MGKACMIYGEGMHTLMDTWEKNNIYYSGKILDIFIVPLSNVGLHACVVYAWYGDFFFFAYDLVRLP